MKDLRSLSTTDLDSIATALRSQWLFAPYSELSVRRFCPKHIAYSTAVCLNSLAAEGMSPSHISMLIQAIIDTRSEVDQLRESVQLVWTGPESDCVSNRDTSVVVRELFSTAKQEVIVAGFAIHQGKIVFQSLVERMQEIPELAVKFFIDIRRSFGDSTSKAALIHRFAERFRSSEWPCEPYPKLYYDPRSLEEGQDKRSSLHAKCIVIDRATSLVTSANFTEAAHHRNIEVGALVQSRRFSDALVDHFSSLLQSGHLLPVPL